MEISLDLGQTRAQGVQGLGRGCHDFSRHLSVPTVAVLELLARATRTRLVAPHVDIGVVRLVFAVGLHVTKGIGSAGAARDGGASAGSSLAANGRRCVVAIDLARTGVLGSLKLGGGVVRRRGSVLDLRCAKRCAGNPRTWCRQASGRRQRPRTCTRPMGRAGQSLADQYRS